MNNNWTEIYCSNCKNKVSIENTYCSYCGNIVTDNMGKNESQTVQNTEREVTDNSHEKDGLILSIISIILFLIFFFAIFI